ncbi:unnamed protein product [Diplocarpon coronariae]
MLADCRGDTALARERGGGDTRSPPAEQKEAGLLACRSASGDLRPGPAMRWGRLGDAGPAMRLSPRLGRKSAATPSVGALPLRQHISIQPPPGSSPATPEPRTEGRKAAPDEARKPQAASQRKRSPSGASPASRNDSSTHLATQESTIYYAPQPTRRNISPPKERHERGTLPSAKRQGNPPFARFASWVEAAWRRRTRTRSWVCVAGVACFLGEELCRESRDDGIVNANVNVVSVDAQKATCEESSGYPSTGASSARPRRSRSAGHVFTVRMAAHPDVEKIGDSSLTRRKGHE